MPRDAQLVTSVPEIMHHKIDPASDEFLLLACDGVWDVMSSEDAVTFVRSRLRSIRKEYMHRMRGGKNIGLDIQTVTADNIGQYTVGNLVDVPPANGEDRSSRVKGWLMRKEDAPDDAAENDDIDSDSISSGSGKLFVCPEPPGEYESTTVYETKNVWGASGWACAMVCEDLIDTCLQLGGTDNLSATLVLLSPYRENSQGNVGGLET